MSRQDRDIFSDTPPAADTRRQIAALCWRMHGSAPEVLLITSRDTGRWIIPKGWLIDGLTEAEAATREAWEEAGVEGRAEPAPLGVFTYRKGLSSQKTVPCAVQVFALRVEGLAISYPEKGQRKRKWLPLGKAAKKVQEPELRHLILTFAPSVAVKG
ncbi:MAG: NUDIX hydrolase [Paracoccaceae bacterium]